MILTTKDLLYIIGYIVSIITILMTVKNQVNNIVKQVDSMRSIIWGDRGILNLVDKSSCKGYQDQIFAKIRANESDVSMIAKEIKELNKNVLTIMISLNIKSPIKGD